MIKMNETEKYVQQKLFELQDEKYRDFHAALMPTVDKETVIGVRSPQLKKFAKDFYKSGDCESFLRALPFTDTPVTEVKAATLSARRCHRPPTLRQTPFPWTIKTQK